MDKGQYWLILVLTPHSSTFPLIYIFSPPFYELQLKNEDCHMCLQARFRQNFLNKFTKEEDINNLKE